MALATLLLPVPIFHCRAFAAVIAIYLFCGSQMNQSGIYYEWNGGTAAFIVPLPKLPPPKE